MRRRDARRAGRRAGLSHEGGRIRPPTDGMRGMSKDRATAGLQRRQKAGNLYSDPWTKRPGGGMMVCNEFGEVDQVLLCNGPSSGVKISVINGLLAALALAAHREPAGIRRPAGPVGRQGAPAASRGATRAARGGRAAVRRGSALADGPGVRAGRRPVPVMAAARTRRAERPASKDGPADVSRASASPSACSDWPSRSSCRR